MDRFDLFAEKLQTVCPSINLRKNEPMCLHTTFRIGGPARFMAFPASEEELKQTISAAAEVGVPYTVVGRGSNLLVADEGVNRLVIQTADRFGWIQADGEDGLKAGSGALLSRIAMEAKRRGLTGLEFAHGIPGTLGGAIVMNAGAYGGEMKDVVVETAFLDQKGNVSKITAEEHGFSYRHSRFEEEPATILYSVIRLKRGETDEIGARMEELSRRRRASQPLSMPSGGSTFKRPAEGYAAELIDRCGLKGRSVGGAQVSPKHAGFVVNTGGATCRDVLTLMEEIQKIVLAETGILLEPELRYLSD